MSEIMTLQNMDHSNTSAYIKHCQEVAATLIHLAPSYNGKRWDDMDIIQRGQLAGEIMTWDKPTYKNIVLGYGTKVTNLLGGLLYDWQDIFPE
jgi:hypothetical protein